METLGTQLRRQRRRLGLSLDDVSRQTGISKPYLSLVETGKTRSTPADPKLRKLEALLKFPAGSLLMRAHLNKTPSDVRDVLQNLLGAGNLDKAYASGALREMVDERAGNVGPVATRFVPVVNRLAAGYPRDFTDMGYPARVADEYVPVAGAGEGNMFAARVWGDSMEPTYRAGDIVVFSADAEPASGQDCFIRLTSGQTTLKRAFFERNPAGDDVVRLQPLNAKYKTKTFPAAQVAGVYRAVWVSRAVGT